MCESNPQNEIRASFSRRQPPNSTSSRRALAAAAWPPPCKVGVALARRTPFLVRPRTHIISIASPASTSHHRRRRALFFRAPVVPSTSSRFFPARMHTLYSQRLWKWEKVSSDSCLCVDISPFAYNASATERMSTHVYCHPSTQSLVLDSVNRACCSSSGDPFRFGRRCFDAFLADGNLTGCFNPSTKLTIPSKRTCDHFGAK
jgi:hypothetical protein